MLQIVYISSAKGNPDVEAILRVSRRNNARDGITGLLYGDGVRFLQALEGEPAAVEAALARVQADPRHRAVVVLSRRDVAEREFGAWDMAFRSPGADSALFLERVSILVRDAAPSVRATFDSFARLDRAA